MTTTIDLDSDLADLQGVAREWAAQIRPFALDVDRDPETVRRHLDLPALGRVATLQIPPEYNPDPLRIGARRYYLMSALERVVFFEEGAWADLGMVLGAPGAPMAGVAVASMGDAALREWFFGAMLSRPTWTFFALTEPAGGSDAAGLRTTLAPTADPDVLTLSGAKRYVGNAVRGEFGVVFARTAPGPLGLAAVLVEASAPGFTTQPIPTLGVRGAQLGAITMDAVPVPRTRVLGQHLSATRRGMWGWLRTFNLLRPAVAIMGVGLARAAYEYVRDNRRSLTATEEHALDRMGRQIDGIRRLTRRAAAAVDADPDNGHLGAAAKLAAARLAERCTRAAATFFGTGARLEHPLLDKLARDAHSIEYMEGTTNVQRLTLFGAVLRDQPGSDHR